MKDLYNRREQRVNEIIEFVGPNQYREQLAAEYEKRYREAFSPKTLKNLATTKKHFRRWCKEFGHDPTLPIDPIVVAEYVDYLGGKLRASTIKNRLWGIAELHRAKFFPSPCRHRLVMLAMRAVRRKYGSTIGQAPPLCKSEVLNIAKGLGNSRVDVRNKALLLTASDSWCRASELVSMKVKHFKLQDDGSSVISVERSKVDPYGRGEFAYLSPLGTDAVKKWIEMKGLSTSDHVFTRARLADDKQPIVPTTVSRIFKKLTGRKEISAHSTRVGGVHDALRLGCDLGSIMVAGRWASPEMPAVYGRQILASDSAAAVVARAYGETVDEG